MKPSERELPLIQRGLVDSCFEEGQYEYGIDVLDKLRTQGYKPSRLHMRQLLYMSLYPPPPHKRTDRTDVPPSPQKGQVQRQKQDIWPKPTSRPMAIALLNAFVRTNSPECLMRGLPFHLYVNNEGVKDVNPFKQEETSIDPEDNSPLRDGVMEMQSLKDCWGLLKDGFVKRQQVERPHLGEDESVQPEIATVGTYAWPVLEWLIQVYEKDERQERDIGRVPYSALLLCQIPPPRSKAGPRWDVEMPLQVAFTCFSPTSQILYPSNHYASFKARWDLGARLISLLINLTLAQPTLLSPTLFLSSLTTRLLDLSLPSLHAFFSGLPANQILFKISVLDRYITTGNPDDERSRKTEALASRARPKFTGRGASDQAPSERATITQDRCKDPYPMPSRGDILGLLSSPLRGSSTSRSGYSPSLLPLPGVKVALAKFHLVSALWSLHLSHKLADSQWNAAVKEDKLRRCLLDGFQMWGGTHKEREQRTTDSEVGQETDEQKIKGYMRSALEMVTLWEASIK